MVDVSNASASASAASNGRNNPNNTSIISQSSNKDKRNKNTKSKTAVLSRARRKLNNRIDKEDDNDERDDVDDDDDDDDDSNVEVPQVHWLVERIGKEIFKVVKRPKYKFYIFMTIGTLPEEHSTIALLSTVCNILYGTLVWLGFMWLPRTWMLVVTLLTLTIGPALVLLFLGTFGMVFVAFALYPIASVTTLWLFYFSTSHFAQAIGRTMGLDRDGNGDVDSLDLLHFLAQSKWGQTLGLHKLYAVLHDASRNHFREIHLRLDQIYGIVQDMHERDIVVAKGPKPSGTNEDPMPCTESCEVSLSKVEKQLKKG